MYLCILYLSGAVWVNPNEQCNKVEWKAHVAAIVRCASHMVEMKCESQRSKSDNIFLDDVFFSLESRWGKREILKLRLEGEITALGGSSCKWSAQNVARIIRQMSFYC